MKLFKNIMLIISLIFISICPLSARIGNAPAQPAPQPVQQPAAQPIPQPAPAPAPAAQPIPQPAPLPQQAPGKKSFNNCITELRTQWKQQDVINAQGVFTQKFINFAVSAKLDPLLTQTLLEAGKNIYLPLSDNMAQNQQSMNAADTMIKHSVLDQRYPFYNSRTKLFKQDHIDEAVRGFAATNPDKTSLDTFRDSMLRRLDDHWNAIGEQHTAPLIPKARQQINSSLEKYGLIKPLQPSQKPQPIPQQPIQPPVMPALQQPAAQIVELKKANNNETAQAFAQRLVDANHQLILSLLFDTQASKFSINPANENSAKQLITALTTNIAREYPNAGNILSSAIQTSPRFGIILNFIGLAEFIFNTLESSSQQPAPAPQPVLPQPVNPPAQQATGPISLNIGGTTVKIVKGDLLKQQVDAIVNAANDDLNHAGGIAGKISDAAGPQLQQYCNSMPNYLGYTKRCPTGKAVITSSFNLSAKGIKNIIHATGPHGTDANREQLLADAYTSSLKVAQQNGIKSIAFPAISTAIFGYPIAQAAPIAFAAVRDFLEQNPNIFKEVRFVLLSDNDFAVYARLVVDL